MEFNKLPPTNRLIIDTIGKNIPIAVPNFSKPITSIKNGDFDAELFKGAVKYPTTAIPGTTGNTLIFAHTSFEERK